MSATAIHVQSLQSQYLAARLAEESPRPARLRDFLFPLALFAVLAVQLWVRVAFIGKGYKLEELRHKALQSDAVLREKRLEYAFLTRPAELAHAARTKSGMVELEPQRVRKIQE